ncbi:hypothetical protein [Nocardioides sp. B-3]|uniref:hypothetical protein n=1 Tax=Nocardioides sp. B-3 TaxID=2895565 RepID=UPI0021529F48|nr:hypothetical protein [Nocardioides sp. B-3]UUZ61283.1 hypothetical protein LP418_12210 [Nocardioides sp. B-3]
MPTFADPALVRRNYVFFEHTARALTKADPDSALNGDELDRIPSYVAVRSRTGLLIRYDFDNAPQRHDYGYEFYPYKNRIWEKTNSFAKPLRGRGEADDAEDRRLRLLLGPDRQRARARQLPTHHILTTH